MPRKTVTSACPICGDPADKAYKPFCCRRCADVDLGRWLKGKYAIPGEPADPRDHLQTEEDGN